MTETKIYNFRLPIEMMERVKNATKQSSATAFVVAAVYARLDGAAEPPAFAETMSAELTALSGQLSEANARREIAANRLAEAGATIRALEIDLANRLPGDAERFEDLGRQIGMWQARAERVEGAGAPANESPMAPLELPVGLVTDRGVVPYVAHVANVKPVAAVVPASDGFAARPVGSLLKSAGKPKGKKK